MGCANSPGKGKHEIVVERFLRAVETGNVNAIYSCSSKYLKIKNINDTVVEVQGISLNPLGYSMWLGKIRPFVFIHKNLNGSIKAMEQQFEKYEFSSLHIICAKGYTDLLNYILPFYVEEFTEFPEVQEFIHSRISYMPGEESFVNNQGLPKYQPIHLAVIQEHANIIMCVYKYFETRAYVPKTLDLGYDESVSGENSALLACRYGKFKIIKLLHQTCKFNFRGKNLRGLNAINILIEGSRENKEKHYFYCLKYLVENICLDVEYNYKFNLLWAEDSEIIDYLETKLKEIGVEATKKQLEKQEAKPVFKTRKPFEFIEKLERPHTHSEFDSEPDS